MKPLTVFLGSISLLYFAGCADPVEQRTGQEVGEQLQRGVSGQGRLGSPNRLPDDQAAEHGVPQNHP